MNNEYIDYLEWEISHNIEFVKKNRNILKCLDVILPSGDDYKVITKKGEIILTHEDICIIKTSIRYSMEKSAAWIDRKTMELEEMKNGNQKSFVKGCTSCPYAGHLELKECPDAYTPISHL